MSSTLSRLFPSGFPSFSASLFASCGMEFETTMPLRYALSMERMASMAPWEKSPWVDRM